MNVEYPAWKSAHRADSQIKERTLSEPGELIRPSVAFVRTIPCADLGGNGFGSFCRNKRASAAAPKPGPSKCQGQTTTHGGEKMLGGENSINPNSEVGVFIDFKGCHRALKFNEVFGIPLRRS